jgi:acetyl esterase/lipase
VFHGAKDPVVPLQSSTDMVEALKRAGGNVQFTVYPEAQHDSWTETYNNRSEWFLSRAGTRGSSAAAGARSKQGASGRIVPGKAAWSAGV